MALFLMWVMFITGGALGVVITAAIADACSSKPSKD